MDQHLSSLYNLTGINIISFNNKTNNTLSSYNHISYQNTLSVIDVNNIINGITSCVNYISALANWDNQKFSEFWEDIDQYILKFLKEKYPCIESFNSVTGDVYGISSITLNGITYTSSYTKFPNLIPYTKQKESYVKSYNGLTGDVSGVSIVQLSQYDYLTYTPENSGIVNLGTFISGGYVISVNGLSGIVSGMTGIKWIDGKILNTQYIDFFPELTAYISSNFLSHLIRNSNDYISGVAKIVNEPSQSDVGTRIVNVGFVDSYVANVIQKIEKNSVPLSKALYDSTLDVYTILLSELEKNINNYWKYKYISLLNIIQPIDQNTPLIQNALPITYLQENIVQGNDNNTIKFKFDKTHYKENLSTMIYYIAKKQKITN